MTALVADKAGASARRVEPLAANNTVTVRSEYVTTGALVNADTIAMVVVPPDAEILDVSVDMDELDIHGTPTMTLDVGIIGGDVDCFLDGDTVCQTGGVARANQKAGFRLGTTDVEQVVGLTVSAAVATSAAAGAIIGCNVTYTIKQ